MAINRSGSRYLYEQLADEIRAKCVSHEWPPDTRIPSIQNLMADYELSDRTVRQAIALLVNEGFLMTRPGKGTYTCP